MTTKQGGGNQLAEYFDALDEGPGVWKWLHYFEHYHHHFQRFVGTRMNLLEIGVYSGGSLGMWKHYFGSDCRIVGVDIEPTCKQYEDEQVEIIIGDQDDGQFWGQFKSQLPTLDIVIDDGHIGVEVDRVHARLEFGGLRDATPFRGLRVVLEVLAGIQIQRQLVQVEPKHVVGAVDILAEIDAARAHVGQQLEEGRQLVFGSVAAVVECNKLPIKELVAPKRGTHWQPYME